MNCQLSPASNKKQNETENRFCSFRREVKRGKSWQRKVLIENYCNTLAILTICIFLPLPHGKLSSFRFFQGGRVVQNEEKYEGSSSLEELATGTDIFNASFSLPFYLLLLVFKSLLFNNCFELEIYIWCARTSAFSYSCFI